MLEKIEFGHLQSNIKVKDIMLDNPITCSAEMSLFKCVRKMRHERVDSLLVIDRKGKFEGIITGKTYTKREIIIIKL
mgnify:CR=1 FL=1